MSAFTNEKNSSMKITKLVKGDFAGTELIRPNMQSFQSFSLHCSTLSGLLFPVLAVVREHDS